MKNIKLFLSSEGVPRPDLLKKLLDTPNSEVKVALINNAQDPYPPSLSEQRENSLVDTFDSLGFQSINVDLREYEGKIEELSKILKSCKLIWVSGGNVFWLRYVMKISGFDIIIKNLLLEGIVYGGWSAGAVVAGPSLKAIDLMDDPNIAPEIIWEGLGLAEFFVWPHWDKEKYLSIQDSALEKMKLLPYESIKLRDGEVIIVEDVDKRIEKK